MYARFYIKGGGSQGPKKLSRGYSPLGSQGHKASPRTKKLSRGYSPLGSKAHEASPRTKKLSRGYPPLSSQGHEASPSTKKLSRGYPPLSSQGHEASPRTNKLSRGYPPLSPPLDFLSPSWDWQTAWAQDGCQRMMQDGLKMARDSPRWASWRLELTGFQAMSVLFEA
jgi:hypothetical protein